MHRVGMVVSIAAVALGVGRAEAAADSSAATPLARFRNGVSAFRAGEYSEAARLLAPLPKEKLLNRDWVLYLLAESRFYDGSYAGARAAYAELTRMSSSRLRSTAAWRVADSLWMEGRRREASDAYRRLLVQSPTAGDPALARFRLAEAATTPAAAKTELERVARDYPGHPLAAEALRRLPAAQRSGVLNAEQRLRRAEQLSDAREWQLALDELAQLPPSLPDDQAAERDYLLGMTKYRMRRDYPGAADLLWKVSTRLKGERAASAAFHGARALSRADRDDEAIARYQEVVKAHPSSRWAAEAQFRSGWLEFNRGRYRESLPALARTVELYPKSPWADDAAWYVTFSHYLIQQYGDALSALDRYARIAQRGQDIEARIVYWRSRILTRLGRAQEARDQLHELVRRWPLGYYGLLARVRLEEIGEKLPMALPRRQVTLPPAPAAAASDSVVARADELLRAGLDVEAGRELQAGEKHVLQRFGEAPGLRILLERYATMGAFSRAYLLAETRGSQSLGSEPEGAARLFWEAAFPRAFREWVERSAAAAGSEDLFVYSIMRKESGFKPHDVSVSDARGLLQMIPPTSARVAASMKRDFYPDELFDPEANIRLGSGYIGALNRKFRQQLALVAGAYNAGPRAMTRWCKQFGARPLDEFVELIAFTETREYVKRVLGIYAHYRYLYGPSPLQLSLKIDASFLPDGPDY